MLFAAEPVTDTSSSQQPKVSARELDSSAFLASTAAAVGLTVASGGVAGAIMLAAFPAQTISATAGISALAYAGKRDAGPCGP